LAQSPNILQLKPTSDIQHPFPNTFPTPNTIVLSRTFPLILSKSSNKLKPDALRYPKFPISDLQAASRAIV
jgi:hypothetical protein